MDMDTDMDMNMGMYMDMDMDVHMDRHFKLYDRQNSVQEPCQLQPGM
jgi:hypothetical protein